MGRLPEQHLNLCELSLLAAERLCGGTEPRPSETERKELEDHLLLCKECRDWLDQEQFLLRMSNRLAKLNTSEATPECLSEGQWMEFVAGLHPPLETQKPIEHAMSCALCSSRLKKVAEQFADDLSDEEEKFLSRLASADRDWQERLARRMQSASGGETSSRNEQKDHRRFPFLRLGLAAASAAILLSALSWFAYFRPSLAVNRLLTLAYAEHRSNDLRMSGSRYAPVEAFRSGDATGLRRPTSLLEAEVLTARELALKPDDPFWLDAHGRADLMEDNYVSALSSLERAHRYAPENQAIRGDLASAYFLRAEELKRAEDYGRAVELLSQVLSKDPRNQVARFNRAVASERLLLLNQAVEDWRRYIALEPTSPWSDEARLRLKDLEEKIHFQQNKSERPLLGPEEFVALLDADQETALRDLDFRIERYFDVALSEWIAQAFLQPENSHAKASRKALDGLAKMLASRHADYWLVDFLEELRRKPKSLAGLPKLIESIETSQTADLDRARAAAVSAERLFHKSGNRAGELLAEFESSYGDQLAHQVTDCLNEAAAGSDLSVIRRYPWLLTQFSLESAICLNLSDEVARKLASDAVEVAKSHHFPVLQLRAVTFLAFLYQYMGDASSAWKYSTQGLERYWEGDYPAMRGYSLYTAVDLVAEDAQEWFLDVQVLREASHLIASGPDLQMRAMAQHRLVNALEMSGDLEAAEKSLLDARALFSQSADGSRKNNLEYEAAIGLAKLDRARSNPDKAILRLEPHRTQVSLLSDKDLVFDYFQNLGLAYFARGASFEAERDLGRALALAEESLAANGDERERLIWCRKADQVYRAMVQLKTARPPWETFAQWEWFKGASLRGAPSLGSDPVPGTSRSSPASSLSPLSLPIASDTVVVSFAVLPLGTYVWTYSQQGVHQIELAISSLEIELLSRRFADHCSRPDSNPAAVAAESRALYRRLFAPLESHLSTYQHLIVEPDRGLWLIPFDALIDLRGTYLGDRYAISISPGLDYLAATRPWSGIGEQSHVLIVGDPAVSGKKPLDEAQQEAKGISRQFRYSKLLLQTDASYGQIAKQMMDAEVFHFSGHAVTSPDGVGLLLGDSMANVAKIRVLELSRLSLAVLSACNSAYGADGIFDDRDSLARLLVGAGVPEVVASRWMVNSRATAALMQEFYSQLLSGQDASRALQQAARKLRQDPEFAHPFYWAGFSAFGKS